MSLFPLFETIAIIDGKPQNLAYHQARFEHAMRNYFQIEPKLQLAEVIKVPAEHLQGLVRCRMDYSAHHFELTFFPYQPRQIKTLQCVYVDEIDYRFKYSDRSQLEALKNDQSDEVVIVHQGYVSDCTIGNLLFFKAGRWYCSEDYLLKGTQLSKLLDEQKVELIKLPISDLFRYEKVMIINALNSFENGQILPISNVKL